MFFVWVVEYCFGEFEVVYCLVVEVFDFNFYGLFCGFFRFFGFSWGFGLRGFGVGVFVGVVNFDVVVVVVGNWFFDEY